jgi:transposase
VTELELVVERCAGIDVHQAQLRVCVRLPGEGPKRVEEFATFGTTTPDLLELSDWLSQRGVTQVAMEGTGVYWKPVYYVLEADFELWLVNAQHVKNVPGRKTDTSDAAWLCRLLEHGLLRKSFVPPREIREIRDLTRYRKALIRERASEVNRLHKVLEDAGVKLATVASDIMGVSGRKMLAALVAGTTDPDVLAEMAKTRLRARLPELRKALNARFREHHGFLVAQILAHVDYLDEAIAQVDERIAAALEPSEAAMTVLLSIPGVQRPHGRGRNRRDRDGHEPVSEQPALGLVGGAVPGQQRERRQAQTRTHHQRQSVAAHGAGGGCLGRDPQERLSAGQVPASPQSTWASARRHRRRARAVGDHPHAALPRRALHRSRRRLLRAPAGRADHPPRDPPARAPWPPGHPQAPR